VDAVEGLEREGPGRRAGRLRGLQPEVLDVPRAKGRLRHRRHRHRPQRQRRRRQLGARQPRARHRLRLARHPRHDGHSEGGHKSLLRPRAVALVLHRLLDGR
jgi:hypothetical protein